MTASLIRVVIVDDHALLREGTRQLLATHCPDMVVMGEAASGDEAYDLVRETLPDVVVMDVQIPNVSGIALTRKITSEFPAVQVLILTAYDDEDYVRAALAAGAAGYLLKTSPVEELAEAIRAVHHGTLVIDRSLASRFLDPKSLRFQVREELTGRERDVLDLMAKGMSNKAIASALHISPRTVEGHLRRMFQKEAVGSRVELLRYAYEHRMISNETPR